ncbi:MAG: phosphonate metabolism protein PhnM [Syntrophorhabdaceae bacterium]|nr:phosphonate metabolism protein PhnM [Syntrophorhabdaceae bacterium]
MLNNKTAHSSFAICNTNVVTEDTVLTNASVYINNGTITDIVYGDKSWKGHVIDGTNKYLFPGFIDIHSDAIEKEIEPRPNTLFPVDYALFELDKKLAACGITTTYYSLSFAEMEVGLRSNSMAASIIERIHGLKNMLTVHAKIHARYEITDYAAIPHLKKLIEDGKIDLLSIMDHTPGQGQFKEITSYKEYYGKVYQKTDRELDNIIKRKMDAKNNGVAEALEFIIKLCREQNIVLASHDDDSANKICQLLKMGVTISEFPVNLDAARYAMEHGIHVCVGAPNIVRGNSQLKNLNAREAIAQGICDIICSDYAPSAILHAIFTLVNNGICSLPQAVRMCSLNPATAVGISDKKGSISIGKDADFILVDISFGIPRIIKTFANGIEIFSTSC